MPCPQILRKTSSKGRLEIVWDDGEVQHLDAFRLRRECPCADCKSLRRQTSGEPQTDSSVAITDIQLVGRYAVSIFFSDGHERGIFPWPYLKNLANEHQE